MGLNMRQLRNDIKGATAIEGAIIFPIVIFVIYALFVIGIFLTSSNSAQRSVEASSRAARMIDNPTQAQIEQVLKDTTGEPMFGEFTRSVSLSTDADGDSYATLEVDYIYDVELLFRKPITISSKSVTHVPIRDLPGDNNTGEVTIDGESGGAEISPTQ